MTTPTPAQHALLAALDRETKLAVARAYRARPQLGESGHPAHLAAVEAFRAARPGPPDADAGRAVRLIIARAAQAAPNWFGKAWVAPNWFGKAWGGAAHRRLPKTS